MFVDYPNEVQNEVLFNLLSAAQFTETGKKYDFPGIKDYDSFANRVPIKKYETIESLIERSRKGEENIFWPTKIKWFAK